MTLNVAPRYEESFLKLTSLSLETIPQALKDTPYWLLWSPQISFVKQTEKVIKKPMGGANWQNTPNTFEVTQKLYTKKQAEYPTGLGFILSTAHPFICIDIDSFSTSNKQMKKQFDSYTEYSPSGNGVHIFIQVMTLADKETLIQKFGAKRFSKKNERDLFISSGYVTMTGDSLDPAISIRMMSVKDISGILSQYFNPKVIALPTENDIEKTGKGLSAEQVRILLRKVDVCGLTSDIFERLSHPTKLAMIDPEETEEARGPWLIICQAVHHNFKGEADGLFLLHEWSRKGEKYDKQALISVYESFSTDPQFLNQRHPITIASLIKLVQAQQPDFQDRNSKGHPMATIQNLDTYLKFYKYNMRYNVITLTPEIEMPETVISKLSYVSNKTDDIDTAHRIISSELLKLNMSAAGFVSLRGSLVDYAKINAYNPIEDYFKSLTSAYDASKDPLSDLVDTITVDPELGPMLVEKMEYAKRKFIRKWLIQVVAAAHTSTTYSNNMFNNVLIFTGDQGIGKTKWVMSLFPDSIKQYCAGSGSLQVQKFRSDAVKQAMELQRTLICNINEIDVLFSTKNYSAFKQMLDENTSTAVLPYGRSATVLTRRTVFIGSTNKSDFLVDQTGNRRITIIPAKGLNYKHSIDLEQLWAHATKWYNDGEKWWLEKTIPEENLAIDTQFKINFKNMFLGNENFIEDLDMYFNIKASSIFYEKVTFRHIRTCIPGLSGLALNTKVFREAKEAFVNWLRQTKHGKVIPKTRSTRAAQYYLAPPLRASIPLTTLKQVASTPKED